MMVNAVSRGDHELVSTLLQRHTDLPHTMEDGRTLLHVAASAGVLQVARVLFQNGYKHTQCHKGRTPLYTAALNGHLDIVHFP